jgi:hypothetical protein
VVLFFSLLICAVLPLFYVVCWGCRSWRHQAKDYNWIIEKHTNIYVVQLS